MSNPFFDILNDISYGKQMLLTDENQGSYQPFIINDIFSRHIDSLSAAEEMNCRPNIPKKFQYIYLMRSMRKAKRFSKMPKYEKPFGFDEVQEKYKYNNSQTQDALAVLSADQIKEIVLMMDKGGLKK